MLMTFTSNAETTIEIPSYIKIHGNFKKIENVNDLPPPILYKLNNQIAHCPGIANHNEEFSPGCSGEAPCQKFLYGGHFDNIWFIDYLSGGAGVLHAFTAFKIENNKIISVLYYEPIDAMPPNKKINLTTLELDAKLSARSNCSDKGKRQSQHIAEVKYGVCTPDESDFYSRFIIK